MQIRRIAIGFVVAIVFALSAGSLYRDPGTPLRTRILRLEPDTGRPGDIVTAYGEHLGPSRVEELVLTNGEVTALVKIIEQSEVSIRFRIPTILSSGQYRVILQPPGIYSQGLEQSVILTVL